MAPDHPILVLQGPSDWADAVAALPVTGRLPLRTAVVPSERHAHALRRALVRSGRGAVLAGTRFAGPLTLAQELLAAEGKELRVGEEGLRPARLLPILEQAAEPALEHFDLALLRDTPGWPEAIAGAISDLEGAGLGPDELPDSSAQWRDLRLLWRLLDEAAGRSVTAARAFAEATAILARRPPRADGPVLIAVTGREPAAQLRFLSALPGATIALFAARPLRERHLARVEALLGPAARAALERAAPPPLPAQPAERDLLARFLFTAPAELADPARPRSGGPDGTVELSEHAGVDAELEAAAEWVAREVFTHRTPLSELALLVPAADPLVSLLASRLSRLPWGDGPFPVHVAGGLPVTDTAGGARALALLRALEGYLPAESVAALLPALRVPGEREHLSHAEAAQLAWSLGTVGGNAARPEGALEWAAGAAAREARLAHAVAALAADPAREEREGHLLRRALDVVRAARPSLEALTELARRVVKGEPLSALCAAVVEFLEVWVLLPGPGAPIPPLLATALEDCRSDALGASVAGREAVELVEERLRSLRVPIRRFGEPAVYVGTLARAEGLDFQAVRILGLAEGSFPSPGREDPVLPDSLRREAGELVPLAEDRALAQLHSFDRAVRGAHRAVALSVPRSDLERSEREASSLLIDAGAALGRPDAAGPLGAPPPEPAPPAPPAPIAPSVKPKGRRGARAVPASQLSFALSPPAAPPPAVPPAPAPREAAIIPDLASLARTGFAPARAAAAAFREAHPLSAAQWQEHAAGTGELHPTWQVEPHLELARIQALRAATALGPAEGLLGDRGPFPPMPGLAPERAISASQLEKLLTCPLAFLFERVLHLRDPGEAPSVRELDALTYGGLFHEVVERLYQEHGEAIVARREGLARWKARARELADAAFAELLARYPLVGAAVREKERSRLVRDLEAFLEYDWNLPLTRFVGVELPFGGAAAPLALDAGGTPLHVRGYVDRLDVEGDHALLRDLKTGADHPRAGAEEGPTARRDVQLGLYSLVARRLAGEWGLPAELQAAYAYVQSGMERPFRGDHGALEQATRSWLALAARLLSEHAFPPTPSADGCTYCAFRPVCGAGLPERAAAATPDTTGAAREYLTLGEAAP